MIIKLIMSKIDQEVVDFLQTEESLLTSILDSLVEQLDKNRDRQSAQTSLARDLTSEIVATTHNEERVQIYSDEAVAHRLAKKANTDIKQLKSIVAEPYFARIELEEDLADGTTKQIEYKIGKIANPDCRIIDWRKAPIAKLYYEYQEGDLYDEEILGRERTGEVKLKNSYEIAKQKIESINCRHGKFGKKDGVWQEMKSNSGPRNNYGELPDILSLITATQFRSITDDAEQAVLIQGVAGSGKTAVAMHRLSWLLFEDNSDLNAADILVTLKSRGLHRYIANTLENLEIDKKTLQLWEEVVLKEFRKIFNKEALSIAVDPAPIGQKRLLYSKEFLTAFMEKAQAKSDANLDNLIDLSTDILSKPESFITSDLLNSSASKAAAQRITSNAQKDFYDLEAMIVILNAYAEIKPSVFRNRYKHLIVDEIQDFAAPELDFLFSILENPQQVTLLGDINQQILSDFSFPGWAYLQKKIGIKADSEIVQLKVSHRSTLPIIRVAEAISGEAHSASGRPGKLPIHFTCGNADKALAATIHWLKTAQEKYPTSLSAVVCPNAQSARELYRNLAPTFNEAVR